MIELSSIETIIFDLGGVVVDIDLQRSINAFKRLGISNPERFIRHGVHNDIFLKLETGAISDSEFYEGIRELAGRNLSDDAIRLAWCAMFTSLPNRRVKIIENLRMRYKVLLLSNTNSIHLSRFDAMAEGYGSLSHLFDNVYYSFRLHDNKPNLSIFKRVIEMEKIIPEKTLFLDDAKKNIEAARKTGMHTMLITPDRQMEDILS
ncbi:MAG: HAD family phosphatase [Chlorobi bacterium]|nr:HAD family phosphatase [Chlorobiota bacterium]